MRAILHILRITVRCVVVAASLLALHASGQSANDGFDPDVNGPVQAIAVQSDGRIVIGGSFTTVGGIARSNLARLNVDGTLDSTFNPGTDIDCLGCYQSVSALAIQADGRILVGGRFTALGATARTNIGRLNTNGTIDASFAADTDGQVLELTVVSGGKVLVAGAFFNLDGQLRTGIGRLNTDGSLDTNFNAGANETVNSLAVQSDGRILVGGDFTTLGGQSRIGIGRLQADGSLDASFNPAAITEEMDALALQVDGKVLVGGDFTMIGDVPRAGIGRLNADGSVDSTFNPGMEGDGLHTLVVQPDGRILVGGFFTTLGGQARTNIGRLNPDGSLDTTFHLEVNSAVNVFSVQPDRSILVGGSFTTLGGMNRNRLGRLYSKGNLDVTFEPEASRGSTNASPLVSVYALAMQPDGKILIGGRFGELGGYPRTNIARLDPDGRVDPTFNPGADQPVLGLSVQFDGRILAVGNFTLIAGHARRGIARLNIDGRLDTTFNASLNHSGEFIRTATLQMDGRIVVGGAFTTLNGMARTNLARLNSDGKVDTTFALWPYDIVNSLALQSDGKILVGGACSNLEFKPCRSIARLTADGALDLGFNPVTDAIVRVVTTVVLQADGKILLGGDFREQSNFESHIGIVRLYPDGNVDSSLRPLILLFNSAGFPSVSTLAIQADGKILVGGDFHFFGVQRREFLARVNPGGGLDYTFVPGTNGLVQGVALQPDGKVLVAGFFQTLGGEPRSRIGRLAAGIVARQTLAVEANGTALAWSHTGCGPEVASALFEQSIDGTNYISIGEAERIDTEWRLTRLSLPLGQNFFVRARGWARGGMGANSSGLIESIAQFYLIPPAHITSVGKAGDGAFQFAFTNTTGASYTVIATTNVVEPSASWEVLGAPLPVGNGLYQFTDPGATNHVRRFYQLRSP